MDCQLWGATRKLQDRPLFEIEFEFELGSSTAGPAARLFIHSLPDILLTNRQAVASQEVCSRGAVVDLGPTWMTGGMQTIGLNIIFSLI